MSQENPHSVHRGDYSANDPSLSVPVSPNHGSVLSPYAWQYDPDFFANAGVDFIYPEEITHRPQSLGSRICYGTGTAYLAGYGIGATYSLFNGLRNPEATTSRLKVNSVLNSVTRHGPLLANSFAVVALMYNIIDGLTIRLLRDGDDDALNTIGSGVATGLLFRSTAGLRRCAIAGLIGGSAAATYYYGQMFLNKEPKKE